MASDKVNYPEAGGIAQAIKHQIRTGSSWDDRSAAEKESLDQIATAIARMVVGDGAHWDAIINYAHAAKPGTDVVEPAALKNDRSFDYPYTAPRPRLGELEHGISNLVRQMPRGENNER